MVVQTTSLGKPYSHQVRSILVPLFKQCDPQCNWMHQNKSITRKSIISVLDPFCLLAVSITSTFHHAAIHSTTHNCIKKIQKGKTSFWVDPKILVAIRWNIHHGPDFSQARKKQEPSGDLVKLPSPKRFLVQQWFPIIPRGNQTWCETSPFSSTMFQ